MVNFQQFSMLTNHRHYKAVLGHREQFITLFHTKKQKLNEAIVFMFMRFKKIL